ncbi:MAG TPA: mechanosensitive ion channel family protein [Burkholderiales bacterium]|nr:mechanosensitive ion channel family protein [Burkholderiales bacterium]
MTPHFWDSEVPYLTVLALAITATLLHVRRSERTTYLNTLWLFMLGAAGQLLAMLLHALDMDKGGAVTHTVFRIVTAIALIRLCGFAAFRLLLPFVGRNPPRIAEDLVILVAYVAYGFVQLRGAGVDLSSIVTTSAILTAVVAFAMQDTLGNVLAGIAIQLDHSVQVGDWVKVGALEGRVRDIRWRSALIETRDWETLVVPNSQLMKSSVAILGRREAAPLQLRRRLNFMVDPGVPPARVIATIEDEMREVGIPNVARLPGPSCVLHGFQDGNLLYQLRYFLTDLLEDEFTDSMVRVHLFASLQRAGIRIAEPQRTVHGVQRDEAHLASVRRRELGRRMELLRGVDIFANLKEEELEEIADRLQYAPFARGDVITKQGDSSHWLYIVAFGEAEARYESPGGETKSVGTIYPGQFFGEMGLFAGEQRQATVLAKTDVECYRLDRASVQGLLLSRPHIAEQVSKVAGSRKTTLVQMREEMAEAERTADAVVSVDLLSRIRRFFGLRA